MSTQEYIINLLERNQAVLESELDSLEQKYKNLKGLLLESMQLVSDLSDDNCPEDFKDAAKTALNRIVEEYFENR